MHGLFHKKWVDILYKRKHSQHVLYIQCLPHYPAIHYLEWISSPNYLSFHKKTAINKTVCTQQSTPESISITTLLWEPSLWDYRLEPFYGLLVSLTSWNIRYSSYISWSGPPLYTFTQFIYANIIGATINDDYSNLRSYARTIHNFRYYICTSIRDQEQIWTEKCKRGLF